MMVSIFMFGVVIKYIYRFVKKYKDNSSKEKIKEIIEIIMMLVLAVSDTLYRNNYLSKMPYYVICISVLLIVIVVEILFKFIMKNNKPVEKNF